MSHANDTSRRWSAVERVRRDAVESTVEDRSADRERLDGPIAASVMLVLDGRDGG